MNNAVRAMIFALGLAGMGLLFIAMLAGLDEGSSSGQFTIEHLASTLSAGLGMVSCAIIAGAALAGMTPSQSPPKTVTFPPQPGAVPPQGQPYPYPQPGAAPQQYAPQQPRQD
ncbi:hypothetical protein E1200_10180 [Actinomadura sp. GC306]|uniref:hypothetical protein n=1 Tax=Actinomadura sp. GC306 TaxID=2530367 RepID=UPI00104B77A7|nr:hypothetical protein [Actinomadura sp. GC306]TDC68908.1 hypothetical protein E1200_10180 [Actinomadura sp. GC306]